MNEQHTANNTDLKTLYGVNYFVDRVCNDEKRIKSFVQEKRFIERFVSLKGTCLDVGCSTGEFLETIGWEGKKYGIEISDYAAGVARDRGIKIVDNYARANSLDAVFYRGTIQHIDSPFQSIAKAVKCLKPDGIIFFIATPNINSIYYRIFQDLPALDKERNFYLPGVKSITNFMRIFSFECVGIEYPYLNSPYASLVKDHARFISKLILKPFGKIGDGIKFPFWKSMMNIAFKKKSDE